MDRQPVHRQDGQPGAEPIGSTTVQVKEFLPDRMKVDAKLSQQVIEGWVKPKGLKGIVDAQNLFGTPAERRVAATLTLRPVWPSFRSWQGYHFFDARRAKEGYTTTLQDGMTDDKGHAEFDLDLDKYADATYQLYFQAKAYEAEGGRNVAANAQTLVSNNDWLVGYKSVDDLGYVKRGSPRTVRLVAIDPTAKAIDVKDLRAQLVEERYVSVLTKQDSGAYKYDSRLKEVPVDDKPLAIPAAGRLHAAHRQAGQLCARDPQRGRRGGEPDRVFGHGRRERHALARPQRGAAGDAREARLQAGRAGRDRDPRALRGQRPDHDRARQGVCARVVPCGYDQLDPAHHGAGRLRGQRLHQRAVHSRSVVGRDLHGR